MAVNRTLRFPASFAVEWDGDASEVRTILQVGEAETIGETLSLDAADNSAHGAIARCLAHFTDGTEL